MKSKLSCWGGMVLLLPDKQNSYSVNCLQNWNISRSWCNESTINFTACVRYYTCLDH